MSNVITIKQFNSNISKSLEMVANTNEELTITKYGKPYVTLKGCKQSNDVCKHSTLKEEKVANISPSKQELLQTLREKEQSILSKNPVKEEIHYCLPCKKLFNRNREAIEEIEVLSNDVFSKSWVCSEHKSKYALV